MRWCFWTSFTTIICSEGWIIKKAVYIAVSEVIWTEGKTFWESRTAKNESAKFWATVLNGLKNRGVGDRPIICVNLLRGVE